MSTALPVNSALQQGGTTDITPEIEKIEPCGLTAAQKKDWEATVSLLMWTAPGFRHLFYKLLSNNDGEYYCIPTRDIPVAATDQKNILINPDTYFKYSMKERVFILAHEIVHNIYRDVEFLRHCQVMGTVPMTDGTTLPFNNQTMQKSMDYRINPLLRDSHIGGVPKDCLLDDAIGTASDKLADVYKRVWEDEESGGKKTGPRGAPQGFDIILKPNVTTPNNNSPSNPQQWAVEIKKAQTLEAMKAQGKGAGALMKMFDEILNPVVPWIDYIKGIFNKKVGSGSFNWKRPNRRAILQDIFLPSKSGNGAGWIACWGDTSGSVIADVNKYLPELQSILEDCRPRRLSVVWCDAAVQRVDELEEPSDLEHTRGEGAPGGGGTSIQPVFDWIKDQQGELPEVFIAFTDGYVDFVDPPPIPNIIWCMTTDKVAPYGETVRINT